MTETETKIVESIINYLNGGNDDFKNNKEFLTLDTESLRKIGREVEKRGYKVQTLHDSSK